MPASLYLDAIATTRISDPVRQSMLPFLDKMFGIPSGAHSLALDARDAVAEARESCLQFIGAVKRSSCIFTGSGTEANNLAILGYARRTGKSTRIFTSSIEHPSVTGACEALERDGYEVTRLAVDEWGRVDFSPLSGQARAGDLVVTHLANYDIGTKQDLSEVVRVCQSVGAVLLVDATFGAGWNTLDMAEAGVDMVTFSPHRFFGPSGIGVLVTRPGVELDPLYYGGSQEFGLRPGTSSVAHAVGAGMACREAMAHMTEWAAATSDHQRDFLTLLLEKVTEVRLNGMEPGVERDPHHISFSVLGIEGEALLLNLDLKGIELTSNTGCVTASEKISPVLRTIGVSEELALGTMVAGLLPEHRAEDIEHAVDVMVSSVARIRSMSQSWHQHQASLDH